MATQTDAELAFHRWQRTVQTLDARSAFLAGFDAGRTWRPTKARKIPSEDHARILDERHSGRTYVSIANEYGVSASRIRAICVQQERLRREVDKK